MTHFRTTLLVGIAVLFGNAAQFQVTLEPADMPQGGTTYPLVNAVVLDFGLMETCRRKRRLGREQLDLYGRCACDTEPDERRIHHSIIGLQ